MRLTSVIGGFGDDPARSQDDSDGLDIISLDPLGGISDDEFEEGITSGADAAAWGGDGEPQP